MSGDLAGNISVPPSPVAFPGLSIQGLRGCAKLSDFQKMDKPFDQAGLFLASIPILAMSEQ